MPPSLDRAEGATSFASRSDDEESETHESSDVDDPTAWRAGAEESDEDDDGSALDHRVAGAFDALNSAIACAVGFRAETATRLSPAK